MIFLNGELNCSVTHCNATVPLRIRLIEGADRATLFQGGLAAFLGDCSMTWDIPEGWALRTVGLGGRRYLCPEHAQR